MDLLDGLPLDVALWPGELAELGDDARREVASWLANEWREGTLEPRLLGGAPTADRLTALRRALAEALNPSARSLVDGIRFPPEDEGTTRRWCWITSWVAMPQDEDLVFMGESNRIPLLEEAAADCPKRDRAISIVTHDVRDKLYGSLQRGADAVRAYLADAARLLPRARAARAEGLVAYLEQLASWERPQQVDREGAVERRRGVNCCYAPESVEVSLVGDEWRSPLGGVSPRGAWCVIDRRTGAMWAEAIPPPEERPRKKPRWKR